MKKTLLEIVQSIASDAESDEINDIDESTEARQIVNIVEQTYYDLRVALNLPEHDGPFKLDATGGTDFPVKMNLPSNVIDLQSLKYDCRELGATYPVFVPMYSVSLAEFTNRMYSLPESADSTIESSDVLINGDTFQFFYRNDEAPSYYTTTDDNSVIFNSYDSSVDNNLQQSKTFGFGRIIPTFTRSNSFIPALDADKFPLLIEEAKISVFNDLKQMDNKISMKRARAHMIRSQNDRQNVKKDTSYGSPYDGFPNYGRRK